MFLLLLVCLFCLSTQAESPPNRPLIIAHRGSSGTLPEHTIPAYELAIEQGADIIECDVTITKDLQLVCAHEAWLNHTSDVKDHPEFADRVRTYLVGDDEITDWFTVDFSLAELKTLRKVQPFAFRDPTFNGQFEIATLDEYIDVAQQANRTVGIYPEIKDPKFINSLPIMKGNKFESIVIKKLHARGYTKPSDPCFVQSFDEEALTYTSSLTQLRLIMLIEDHVSDEKLKAWSSMFAGVGPWKNQIVPTIPDAAGLKTNLQTPTNLVERIHAVGMKVHPYTFRNEDRYLAWEYGQNPIAEYALFLSLGIDGFFTDFTATLHYFLAREIPNGYPYDLRPSEHPQ